jgi:hypothetical protein
MRSTDRDRRDWSLLIFIVPLGILLMIIAGQIAMRVVPQWRLNTGMGSNLDLETESGRSNGPRPVFDPLIFTPFPWWDTFLTPSGDGVSFPPFVVIEPFSTSSSPTSMPTVTATEIIPTMTVQPSPTLYIPPPNTPTKKPSEQNTPTNPPVPSAMPTEIPSEIPTEIPPTATPTGSSSTLDPSLMIPPPPEIGIGPPDGYIGTIIPGRYTVIDLGSTPIIVVGYGNDYDYDLVYYESEFGNLGVEIQLDNVILGISIYPDGQIYYEIFNWGNGVVDYNSNVWDVLPEIDNQKIPMSDLYPYPGTGILIDVDNAPSAPPPGNYRYLVIISPLGGDGDWTEVDSIEILIPP